MKLYPRMPAIVAIVLTLGAGVGIIAATGQHRTTDLSRATLEQLEKQVAESQDGATWLAYGDRLRETGQADRAVEAYKRALAYKPDLTDARVNLGLALAAGKNPDAFFDYVLKLCVNYPKLADNLMQRPELAELHDNPRWAGTVVTARAQAVD